MNVLALRADSYGCGHYRISLPARHAGVPVQVEDRIPLNMRRVGATNQRILISVPVGADVVVIQRPVSHHMPAIISMLQQQGVAVVVELDDDLCALDPRHGAYAALHPANTPHANWQHLRTCCGAADLVTVTTEPLARKYAAHGRVAVLPNCVPQALLKLKSPLDADFGWTGSLASHPRDLGVLGTAVRDLVNDDGFSFRVVGDGKGVAKQLGLGGVDDTGWLDLDLYYRAAAQLRVGLVPLQDTAFNEAKSALKGIEYAALGIPFVASDTPEYVDLQSRGAGFLADRPRRWRSMVRWLLQNVSHREELVQAGRDTVAAYFTIEDQGWRWAEAWERAIAYRKELGSMPRVVA